MQGRFVFRRLVVRQIGYGCRTFTFLERSSFYVSSVIFCDCHTLHLVGSQNIITIVFGVGGGRES